jgi:hypothetical protein
MMMNLAIGLFVLAAVTGASMAIPRFVSGAQPKIVLAALHGIFAASALVTLALVVFTAGATGGANIALGLFVLAAVGGFVLLSFHLRGRQLPAALVLGHGLLAVGTFLFLLWTVWTGSA